MRRCAKLGKQPTWVRVEDALKPAVEIEALVEPFLGGDDPLFGTRFTGSLVDFFDPQALAEFASWPARRADDPVRLRGGPGRLGWAASTYIDLPKNELQFRARAGIPTNLGLTQPLHPKAAYKRSYFVDWPALNAHKAALLPRLDGLRGRPAPGPAALDQRIGFPRRAGADEPQFLPGAALVRTGPVGRAVVEAAPAAACAGCAQLRLELRADRPGKRAGLRERRAGCWRSPSTG